MTTLSPLLTKKANQSPNQTHLKPPSLTPTITQAATNTNHAKIPPPSPNTTHIIPTSLPPSTFTSQMQKHNQYLIPNGLKTN